jgi:homogentisate 1,2-dioxygenase
MFVWSKPMIDYRTLGEISKKPHTVFEPKSLSKLPNNLKMAAEHVFTREGFSDLYSILYQKNAPTHETQVTNYSKKGHSFPHEPLSAQELEAQKLLRRHFPTPQIQNTGNFLQARTTLLYNSDCTVGISTPTENTSKHSEFFSNGDSDELYFIAQGQGSFETIFGKLSFYQHDYIFVPKGTPYRIEFNETENQKYFIVEGFKQFGIPKEFRHPQGQLKLDSPYTHRDFRSPQELLTVKGNPGIVVKKKNRLTFHEYTEFPYQVVGWDGWMYPFAFSVHNFQPKTSTIHLPPSSHSVFSANGFVMMNFVPRMLDYGSNAIPCPYPHTSVDCDEVLFYAEGQFTSRKAISRHSISFHPCGIPHGPHPEKYEQSVGHQKTDELAIMVDTFAPLNISKAALKFEDPSYHFSWNASNCL